MSDQIKNTEIEPEDSHIEQWVSFKIEHEYYALPIYDVREITPYIETDPVPGASKIVDGVLNIRGSVATILSGRKFIASGKDNIESPKHIVVLDIASELMGICVDEIGGLISFSDTNVQPNLGSVKKEIICGTVHIEEQLYILLDLKNFQETIKLENIEEDGELHV